MGKYRFWFPIISVLVLYCLSVNCQHTKDTTIKTDNLPKLDLKHQNRELKARRIKRDLNKRFVEIPLPSIEQFKNLSKHPEFHVDIPPINKILNIKKRQTENVISNQVEPVGNISLEEKLGGLGTQQEIKANSNPNDEEKLDKDQQKLRSIFNLLTVIKSDLYNLFNENMTNTSPNEFTNNWSASNYSQGWNLQPVQQLESNPNVPKSNNETAVVDPRGWDVQTVPQLNTTKSNVSASIDLLSLNTQPVTQPVTTVN